MKLKHLRVERFRGIRVLDWTVHGDTICLIGRGDSAKSTILDAIESVLSPRWNLPFADCDFYDGNCGEPIIIKATVGELPEEILTEDKFGLFQRGWDPDSGIVDEPDDRQEVVLTIQLTMDESLEPEWTVVTDRHSEGKKISAKDRERIGVARLGSSVDRDLAWARGSALSRCTEDFDGLNRAMAEAYRCARESFGTGCISKLDEAARKAQEAAKRLGVNQSSTQGYKPGLDTRVVTPTAAAVCLHEGAIPLRSAGLGSRRLAALALQRTGIARGAIILIDEVEHGLEPYRLRNLLRLLEVPAASYRGSELDEDASVNQVIMVSHSPVVVRELAADQIWVVHRRLDRTEVLRVSRELQPLVRAVPSALLSRKVVVCEGKTELGFLRGLEDFWAKRHENIPPACHGVDFAEGGGRTDGPTKALRLTKLGYKVAYFGDSDEPIDPDKTTLEKNGVKVILWNDRVSLEQRICLDVPWDHLQEVIDLAIEIQEERTENGEQSVLDTIARQLGVQANCLSREVTTWTYIDRDEVTIREAIGKAAKRSNSKRGRGWFKDITNGAALARIIQSSLPSISDSDLAEKLEELEDWMYA